MRLTNGFTLIELLATLAIAAILATLAAPSFSTLMLDTRRTTAVNGFFHALFLARSESIKRGGVVSVCKSPNGQSCTNRGAEWDSGWIVFVNSDRDDPPVRDAGETLIAAYDGWREGRITSNRLAYSFRPYTQGVVNGTIVFCDSRGPAEARAIIISHTGRPRVARRDSSGRLLRCPPG